MEKIQNLGMRKNKIGNGSHYWGLFLCPFCQRKVERQLGNGKRDKACGCIRKERALTLNKTHGDSGTLTYGIWRGMLNRCLNPNEPSFKNYGGRGIKVCDEWIKSYTSFKSWVLHCGNYKLGLQIDRKNNDGDYCPENCRFVTEAVNCQNRRSTKLTFEKAEQVRKLYKTGAYHQRELAKIYGVLQTTISMIVNNQTWVQKH